MVHRHYQFPFSLRRLGFWPLFVSAYALFTKTAADYDICVEDFWVRHSLHPSVDLGMEIRDTGGNALFTQDLLHQTETHVAHLLDFKLLDLMADSSEIAVASTQYENKSLSGGSNNKVMRVKDELYPSYALEMKNIRFALWLQMVDKLHGTPADIMARAGTEATKAVAGTVGPNK